MDDRVARTIRFPAELLEWAQEVMERGESFNELVVRAVDKDVRRRRGLKAHAEILRISEDVKARTGVQASSAAEIREMRNAYRERG